MQKIPSPLKTSPRNTEDKYSELLNHNIIVKSIVDCYIKNFEDQYHGVSAVFQHLSTIEKQFEWLIG